MPKRIKTKYPGVYYRKARRLGRNGMEPVYYIVFKKHGKFHEEKVGRQYVDNMSAAKAAQIRGQRLEGRKLSRKELIEAEENKWAITRLWEEYKRSKPDLRGMSNDRNRFKNYIQPHFGDKEPKEIQPSQVDKLRVDMLKTKKPQTVKHVLSLLRRICNFGAKKQLCEELTFKIEMPRVDNEKTEDLNPEQLNRLLEAIENEPNRHIANLMKLALFTGMRRGGLFRLKWEDIDFQRGFIELRDPKGGRNQKIPMNEQARQILAGHPRGESPYVFPGRWGGPRTDIRKQVHRIKEEAGLPKDFRPLHGLRHVYASMLASSGRVDMYTLQKLLTHKSPTMTQRYAHLRDETLKKASSLAGELLVQQAKKNRNKNI